MPLYLGFIDFLLILHSPDH